MIEDGDSFALRGARYWLLCFAIYGALVYSTALHYAYSPESSINLTWYFGPAEQETPVFMARYPDYAQFNGQNVSQRVRDFWKLSSFHQDAAYYLLQVESASLSIPPHKYRFLTPTVVRWLTWVTHLPALFAWVLLNVGLTLMTAMLFTRYLQTDFGFSPALSLVGGMLFVTMVANTATVAFPVIEPASLLVSLLIFMAVRRRNVPIFLLVSCAGVATKEILVFSGILWFANTFQLQRPMRLVADLAISAVPFVVFGVIRHVLGGGVLEVNYGYNLLQGQFPTQYGARMFDAHGLLDLAVKTFLAFTFLWFGVVNLRRHPFLRRSAVVIPVVMLAAIVLSRQIVRVQGVVFPLVVPAFLFFFVREADATSGSGPARGLGSRLSA